MKNLKDLFEKLVDYFTIQKPQKEVAEEVELTEEQAKFPIRGSEKDREKNTFQSYKRLRKRVIQSYPSERGQRKIYFSVFLNIDIFRYKDKQFRSGNRVVTAPSPRVASHNTLQCQEKTFYNAVFLYSLNGILGTSRHITAA